MSALHLHFILNTCVEWTLVNMNAQMNNNNHKHRTIIDNYVYILLINGLPLSMAYFHLVS